MKWTDVKHPKCEVVLGAADKSKKYPASCMTPTSVKNVKFANNKHGTKKILIYAYIMNITVPRMVVT